MTRSLHLAARDQYRYPLTEEEIMGYMVIAGAVLALFGIVVILHDKIAERHERKHPK